MSTLYRLVQKKGTVLLSTNLAWPAVAGCSRADTFSQLNAISFAQPCMMLVDFKNECGDLRLQSPYFTLKFVLPQCLNVEIGLGNPGVPYTFLESIGFIHIWFPLDRLDLNLVKVQTHSATTAPKCVSLLLLPPPPLSRHTGFSLASSLPGNVHGTQWMQGKNKLNSELLSTLLIYGFVSFRYFCKML